MSLITQIIIISYSLLFGMFMGIAYRLISNKKSIYDILYWIIMTIILVIYLEKYNNGRLLFYQIIVIIMGYIIYYKYLKKPLNNRITNNKIYLMGLKKVIKSFIFPPLLLFIYKKIKNKFKKQVQ